MRADRKKNKKKYKKSVDKLKTAAYNRSIERRKADRKKNKKKKFKKSVDKQKTLAYNKSIERHST